MRIKHIGNKDDVIYLEMYITRLAMSMEQIEDTEHLLTRFKENKKSTEESIKKLVEKWQR